jgi:ABC-2 type transport system ATP-binding protein
MNESRSTESILLVQSASLQLKKVRILNDISFELSTGKVLGVVGHNGAGKTTLFHTILGLKFLDSGTIELFKHPATHPEARAQLGYVPERPYLSMEQTLRETLTYFGKLRGMKNDVILPQIESGSKRMHLENALDRKLSTFSKGMLQKILLLQSEMHSPDLLILDEPMSGLDPESREDLKSHLRSLKKSGKAILFSSHVPEDVVDLADGVLELEKGNVIYYGPISEWRKA